MERSKRSHWSSRFSPAWAANTGNKNCRYSRASGPPNPGRPIPLRVIAIGMMRAAAATNPTAAPIAPFPPKKREKAHAAPSSVTVRDIP